MSREIGEIILQGAQQVTQHLQTQQQLGFQMQKFGFQVQMFEQEMAQSKELAKLREERLAEEQKINALRAQTAATQAKTAEGNLGAREREISLQEELQDTIRALKEAQARQAASEARQSEIQAELVESTKEARRRKFLAETEQEEVAADVARDTKEAKVSRAQADATVAGARAGQVQEELRGERELTDAQAKLARTRQEALTSPSAGPGVSTSERRFRFDKSEQAAFMAVQAEPQKWLGEDISPDLVSLARSVRSMGELSHQIDENRRSVTDLQSGVGIFEPAVQQKVKDIEAETQKLIDLQTRIIEVKNEAIGNPDSPIGQTVDSFLGFGGAVSRQLQAAETQLKTLQGGPQALSQPELRQMMFRKVDNAAVSTEQLDAFLQTFDPKSTSTEDIMAAGQQLQSIFGPMSFSDFKASLPHINEYLKRQGVTPSEYAPVFRSMINTYGFSIDE